MSLTYFEKIFYQRTTGTEKKFFALYVAQKNIKIFQLIFRAENKEKKNFFYESKARNEWQNDQIIKKNKFGTFTSIAFIIFLQPKNSAEFFFNQILHFFPSIYTVFLFFWLRVDRMP